MLKIPQHIDPVRIESEESGRLLMLPVISKLFELSSAPISEL
jgi:hypothetical protein